MTTTSVRLSDLSLKFPSLISYRAESFFPRQRVLTRFNNHLSVLDYVEKAQTADFETAIHYSRKFTNKNFEHLIITRFRIWKISNLVVGSLWDNLRNMRHQYHDFIFRFAFSRMRLQSVLD
jgi:hypothetical protein